MSLAPILRKIFFVDLLKGMRVTFKYQDPKEIYTEQYPLERPEVAERYRGLHRLGNDPETGNTMCIACDLCALACPEKLITVKSVRDETTKKKKLTTWSVDLSRCMFCGLCEDACPTKALKLSKDYEFALYSRDGLVLDREKIEKGTEPTVYER